MANKEFQFSDQAGRPISGILETPQGPLRGWAVFAHCFTCGKTNLAAVRISRRLAERGIGVLRFDFAGSGDANIGPSFASDVADLKSAIAAMAAADQTPSLLIGHSLGGTAALLAASGSPQIRALVTVNAPFEAVHVLATIGSDNVAQIESQGEAVVALAGRPFRIGANFIRQVRDHDTASAIKSLNLSLLVLHAPLDGTVGIANATQIFSAAKHPKSFVSLDTADHLLTASADAAYAADVIAAWAARYLSSVDEPVAAKADHGAVVEETRSGKFQVRIETGGLIFHGDEPLAAGGTASGPSPYDLLCAALGACTTMTIRAYADRKGLTIARVRTTVDYVKDSLTDKPDRFVRTIAIEGALDPDQHARVLEIAARCPVHRTLVGGSRVETTVPDENR